MNVDVTPRTTTSSNLVKTPIAMMSVHRVKYAAREIVRLVGSNARHGDAFSMSQPSLVLVRQRTHENGRSSVCLHTYWTKEQRWQGSARRTKTRVSWCRVHQGPGASTFITTITPFMHPLPTLLYNCISKTYRAGRGCTLDRKVVVRPLMRDL